jgi:hypothetical protein
MFYAGIDADHLCNSWSDCRSCQFGLCSIISCSISPSSHGPNHREAQTDILLNRNVLFKRHLQLGVPFCLKLHLNTSWTCETADWLTPEVMENRTAKRGKTDTDTLAIPVWYEYNACWGNVTSTARNIIKKHHHISGDVVILKCWHSRRALWHFAVLLLVLLHLLSLSLHNS